MTGDSFTNLLQIMTVEETMKLLATNINSITLYDVRAMTVEHRAFLHSAANRLQHRTQALIMPLQTIILKLKLVGLSLVR